MPDITKKKQTTTGTGSARKKALEETKKRLEAKKSIAEAFEADGYTPDKPNTYVRDVKVGTTPVIGAGQYKVRERRMPSNVGFPANMGNVGARQDVARKQTLNSALGLLQRALGTTAPQKFNTSGAMTTPTTKASQAAYRNAKAIGADTTNIKAKTRNTVQPEVTTKFVKQFGDSLKAEPDYESAKALGIDLKDTQWNPPTTNAAAITGTEQERQQQIEQAEADTASDKLTAGEVLKSIGNDAFQGVAGELAHSTYGLLAGIENLGEKYLLGYENPEEVSGLFQTLYDVQSQDYNARQAQIQSTSEKSKVMSMVNQAVPNLARNMRDMALTFATGGLWAGGSMLSAASEEALSKTMMTATEGLGAQASMALRNAMSNPTFWTVFTEEAGGNFNDAKASGATDAQALTAAILSGVPNALIEIGGGNEEIYKEIASDGFKKVITNVAELAGNALEEGGEEILQDAVSGIADKVTWGRDKAWTTDKFDTQEDSVFNLARVLQAAGYAAVDTILMAGIGTGARAAGEAVGNRIDRAKLGKEIKRQDGGQKLLQIAERSSDEDTRAAANTIWEELRNGQEVTTGQLSDLAKRLSNDRSFDWASAQREVETADNTYVRQTQSQQTEPSTHIETASQTARADGNTASIQAIQEPETQAAPEESAAVTHEVTPSVATPVATPEQRQVAREQPLEISTRELNSFGENGQRALRAGLTRAAQNGESQTAYKNAFTAYYKWGTWGKDISQIDSAFSGNISQSAAYAAYMSGVNDNAAIVAHNTANQRKATGTGGLMQGTHNSKVDANTRNYLDALGRAFRVSIAIDDEGSGYNGMLDKNGVVHIAADTTRPAAGVLNHELTHVLRSRSESDYQTYKNVVAAFINKESEGAFEQRVEELIDLYAENGQTLTRDESEEEIVANASEMFLRDKESVNLMVKQNRGVAKKILDAIRSIINKLKGIVRDGRIHNKEAQILSRDMEAFQKAERLWVSALSESTGEMNEEVSVNEKTAPTKEAKAERFQIREASDGKPVVVVTDNIFDGHSGEKSVDVIYKYLKGHIGEVYPLIESGQKVYIGKDLPGEYTRSKYTQNATPSVKYVKGQAAQNIGEMIEIATNRKWEKNRKEKHEHNAKYGFYKYDTRFAVKNKSGTYVIYDSTIVIRNDEDGKKYFYDITKIKRDSRHLAGPSYEVRYSETGKPVSDVTASYDSSIPGNSENVNSQNTQTKEKFSLKETDKESRKNIEPNGGQPYYNDRSYRGYSKNGALSAYGHAMFADDPDSISEYSGRDDPRDRGFYTVMHSDLESIDNLKAAIAEAWDEDAENGMTPSGYEDVTGEEIAEQFDPEDIVDSAGAWDNGELISWAFDRGLFDDVSGVKTYDGAVAWDESIIHRANEDSDEGIIGEIKDEKLQLREDNPYDWLDDGDEDYPDEDTAPTPGDEDAPPETVIKEDLGGDWLDRQVDRTISSNENVEPTIAAIRAEGRAFKAVKPESVSNIVKAAAKQYGAADTAQLNAAVHGALDYLARHGEDGTESAVASVYQAVKSALGKAESVDRTMYDETKGMRDYLKTTRIYIPDSVKSDITDYNDFRKSLFGKVRIVNDPTAMHIDQAYAELSAQYPGLLSSEIINPSAQLQEIADTLDAAQPVIVASYGEDGQTSFIGNINEASIDMTTDILHNLAQTAITQAKDADTRKKLAAQRKRFGEQKKKLRQELRNKYKTELISQQTEAKAQAALAQTQLRQTEKNLVRAKKQAEKDAAKAQERIAAIREANRLSKKKAADRREITKRRQSVEKITTRLYRKLSSPTDTQHIPQGFRVSVANFLSSLDFEGRDKAGNVKDTKVNDAWRELVQECRRIARAEASNADSTYLTIDPDLADRLDELSKTPVRDMNKEQIEELYKAARAIEKAVTDADQVRVNGQMQQATDVARRIIDENRSKAKETRRILSGLQGMEKFFKYDLLDPTRFADMWGDGFKAVYSDLRSAELEKIRLWAQFEKDTEKMMGNSGYSKKKAWKSEKTIHKVTLDSGKKIELSSAQIMEIYLLNNREQGRSHLYGGGITPDSIKNKGVVTENRASYRLTEQDVKKMIELLSADEKKMADQMGQYASTTMSGWGNKASMELYGYKKFTESNYWPISTDSAWTHSDVSAETAGSTRDSASIKNLGMTKAVVQKASNPIMIGSAFDTFSKHATQMAAYSAYLNPIENLNKVLNWQTRHDGNWRSVRESIRMVGGQNAISYLNTFIRDVNGQVRTEQNPYSPLMGRAKAAAIAGNLRVVVQQPTAWGRAAAIIPPQYMIGGLVGKVDTKEMRQYAPIAQWKDWGYFRDGTTGANMKQLMLGKNSVADNVTDKAMALAGIMDDATWKRLYKSVELWVAHDMGENQSEAYHQEVGRRFTDMIDRTQVVDSVFERTQAMRSTNYGWQIATAFMAEPLKTYNLLVGTARGIANAEKGAKGAAVKTFLKAAIGFGLQAVLNAAAQSLWDIGRDKDDDETWQEKFLQAMFGDEVVEAVRTGEPLSGTPTEIVSAALGGNLQGNLNVLNLIPVFKDVMSWLDGYDTELLGVSDVKSVIEMGGSLYKSMTGEPQKKTTVYQAIQLFRKISSITGLPIGNIYREVESGVNLATTLYAQYGEDSKKATELRFKFDQYYLTGSENRKTYYSMIYKARQEGNEKLAMEIANWLIDQGVTRKSIDTALQKMINDDAENSDLITEYADAYNSGDIAKMSSLIDKAKKRGISGDELQTSAKKLLNASESTDDEEKEYYTDGFGGDAEYDNTYLYDQLADDLLSGDESGAEKITAELKESGKEQKDIDSGVKSKIKARMLKDAGYESQEDMEATGDEFDVDSKEYKYLHDTYSWTQYNSHSLADAALAGDSEKISRILKDAVGQTNTSGNVWTEESLKESAIRYTLQSEFNEVYENGGGDESKWRPYVKAMQTLGKPWDDILKSYHKSTAYKELTGKK